MGKKKSDGFDDCVTISLEAGPDTTMAPVMGGPDGKEMVGVKLVPLFATPRSIPSVLYCRTLTPEGTTVYKAVLRLSGSSGKLSIADRSETVRPAFLDPNGGGSAGEEDEENEENDSDPKLVPK